MGGLDLSPLVVLVGDLRAPDHPAAERLRLHVIRPTRAARSPCESVCSDFPVRFLRSVSRSYTAATFAAGATGRSRRPPPGLRPASSCRRVLDQTDDVVLPEGKNGGASLPPEPIHRRGRSRGTSRRAGRSARRCRRGSRARRGRCGRRPSGPRAPAAPSARAPAPTRRSSGRGPRPRRGPRRARTAPPCRCRRRSAAPAPTCRRSPYRPPPAPPPAAVARTSAAAPHRPPRSPRHELAAESPPAESPAGAAAVNGGRARRAAAGAGR